jgi:hypothetical protein
MAKWYKKYSDGTVERDYNAETNDAVASAGAAILVPLIIIAAAGIILMRYALYFISIFAMFAVWFIFNKLVLKKIASRLPAFLANKPGLFSGAAAIILLLFVLFPMAGNHYAYATDDANMDSDKIIALENGGPVNLYGKPSGFKNQGKPRAVLQPGETVTIIGATRDRNDYRITTAAKKTGYVTKNALPAEDMPYRFNVLGKVFGAGRGVKNEIQAKRRIENAAEAIEALTTETLEQNLTPLNISSSPKDKDGNGIDWGWITIKGIAYLDDLTVIKVERGDEHFSMGELRIGRSLGERFFVGNGADENDSGTYFIMEAGQTNYGYPLQGYRYYQTARGAEGGAYLFFHPFKFKIFDLINVRRSTPGDRDSGENVLGVQIK